jgi:hypothetical protein
LSGADWDGGRFNVATFLLSWLSKQYGGLDGSIFLREQPGDWLVLENLSERTGGAREPLATRLAPRRDRSRYTIGRDPGSDLIINEPEVSLAHLLLEPDDDGVWTIRRASPDAPARLDGLQLGDFPVALGSGARIELGGLAITFLSGSDLHARLRWP